MLDFIELAKQCAPTVAPETMAAIVKTESGFKAFAIGVNGTSRLERQPGTKVEAVATAKWLIENGYNIDLGLGQINSNNLARTSMTIEDAFDPCKNLGAAAKILTDNYLAVVPRVGHGQKALHADFSTYNTGSPSRGFTNGYVQRVLANSMAVIPRTGPTVWSGLVGPGTVEDHTPVTLAVSSPAKHPVLLSVSPEPATTDKSAINSDPQKKPVAIKPVVSVYEHTADLTTVYR